MASKKIPIGFNPAEAELEHRVEVMMEPVKNKPTASLASADDAPLLKSVSTKVNVVMHDDSTPPSDAPTPIDIFSDPKTAPAVPADLLKKLTAKAEPVTPTDLKPEAVPAPVIKATPPPPPTPILPPSPFIANRVPQLIASTAPKPKPAVIDGIKPIVNTALDTPDAAPDFKTDNDLPGSPDSLDVPPVALDDAKTTAAIAAIAASDSDELLAAQDAIREQSGGNAEKNGKAVAVPRQSSGRRKLWLVALALSLLLVALLALPFSRYKLAGLVYKQTVQLQIIDSVTNRPVNKAQIIADGKTLNADSNGKASFKLPVGTHNVTINKQYYQSLTLRTFTGFKSAAIKTVPLVATGRQVTVTVANALNGKPLANAEISLAHTSAKTDDQGKAVIVLPADQKTLAGTISATSYASSAVTVQITDALVSANNFKLVPSGSIYVLSNASGTIDIVKTNLDGSKPTTVLRGTGKEDANTTVLLASRDWKYLVLKAQRDSSQAALYLLDTSTDKLVEFDSGDANFTPIGWYGHAFMYDAVRNNVATSQNAHEQIKSYDAERGQLNQLDSSQAATATTGFSYQGFYNFNLVDNELVYNTQWYSSGGADISTKNATIRAVQYNGQNKKDYQNIPAAGLAYIQAAQVSPQVVYYATFNYSDNKSQFYAFQNLSVTSPAAVTAASFNKTFPSYVLAPGAKQTIWNETRNGKPVVMLGDANAANAQTIASLNGFNVYGWYSDDYLLVSKNHSQLFIVPVSGTPAPLALTNYFKPGQNVASYSYGYGGL